MKEELKSLEGCVTEAPYLLEKEKLEVWGLVLSMAASSFAFWAYRLLATARTPETLVQASSQAVTLLASQPCFACCRVVVGSYRAPKPRL